MREEDGMGEVGKQVNMEVERQGRWCHWEDFPHQRLRAYHLDLYLSRVWRGSGGAQKLGGAAHTLRPNVKKERNNSVRRRVLRKKVVRRKGPTFRHMMGLGSF